MIEKLFGSRSRVRILQLLMLHPEQRFYIREIARMLNEQMNAVRRELNNCEKLGIVTASEHQRKKYYSVAANHNMIPFLRNLLVTALWTYDEAYIKALTEAGTVSGLLVLGFFMGNHNDAPVDVCIIGDISSDKVRPLVEVWEKELHTHLRYTMMAKDEYAYRLSVSDRFLHSITQAPHIELISPK
ncbi:MAG: winged helix-turn-helix domain-containing protein [Candidatus Kerfeldbacteria bacterium]|nr:winged helix-turn-helix domain-containing protein [Candidatus Kerfeldbacteria bacterium]